MVCGVGKLVLCGYFYYSFLKASFNCARALFVVSKKISKDDTSHLLLELMLNRHLRPSISFIQTNVPVS